MNEKYERPSAQNPDDTDKYGISHVSLDGYGHMGNACSATDCTGLIPALPESEEELEAYEEMYQFCAQKPRSAAAEADTIS